MTLVDALLIWVKAFDDDVETLDDVDAERLSRILNQIDSQFFSLTEPVSVAHVEARCKQFLNIDDEGVTRLTTRDPVVRCIQLCVACALLCEQKASFINMVMQLDENVQHHAMSTCQVVMEARDACRVTKLEEELNQARDKLNYYQMENDAIRETNEAQIGLRKQIESRDTRIFELEEDLMRSEAARDAVEAEVEALRRQASELRRQLKEAKDASNGEVRTLRDQLDEAHERVARSAETEAKLRRKLKEAEVIQQPIEVAAPVVVGGEVAALQRRVDFLKNELKAKASDLFETQEARRILALECEEWKQKYNKCCAKARDVLTDLRTGGGEAQQQLEAELVAKELELRLMTVAWHEVASRAARGSAEQRMRSAQ